MDYGGHHAGEIAQFWNHLNLAGLTTFDVNNTFSGTTYPEFPESNGGLCGYWVYAVSSTSNSMILSDYKGTVGSYTLRSCLKPKDARLIDLKMDDGLPTDGVIIAANGEEGGTCLSGSAYDLTNTALGCRLRYVLETK